MARVEALMDNPETAKHILACNGWVMNDDPLRNFADEGVSRATRALLLGLDCSMLCRTVRVCLYRLNSLLQYACVTALHTHIRNSEIQSTLHAEFR